MYEFKAVGEIARAFVLAFVFFAVVELRNVADIWAWESWWRPLVGGGLTAGFGAAAGALTRVRGGS